MKRLTPLLLIAGLVAILVAIEVFRPRPYDQRLRVERAGTEPFDAEMLYRLLPGWLGAPVEPVDAPPFEVLADTTLQRTLYLFLTGSFEPDEAEADRLLAFAARGNTVLMVAQDFGGPLSWALGDPRGRARQDAAQARADSLEAAVEEAIEQDPDRPEADEDELYEDPIFDDPDLYWDGLDTDSYFGDFSFFGGEDRLASGDTLTLADPAVRPEHGDGFAFPIALNAASLVGIDSSRTAILGFDAEGDPTLVRVAVGDGAVLVSSVPLAFTNAALSKGDGAAYLEGVFGYVPAVDRVLWDERYKPLRQLAGSPLSVVARMPSLSWAILLIGLGSLLFLLFRGRRWQRPIPVVAPPPNAQREFARVLGRLHYVRGDRGWLARRKARVFEDHVRTRLGLPDADLADATARRAAARAGVDEADALALFQRLRNLRADPSPEPERLVSIDQEIDAFFDRAAAPATRLSDADEPGADEPVASPDAPTA